MEVFEVKTNKKKYLDLLLLADEQESMIDRYLEDGDMYILENDGTKAVMVVKEIDNKNLEIKNLAVSPNSQKKGYGKYMIDYVSRKYKEKYEYLYVGTGDSPLTIPFYEKCGFKRSHSIKNFFINNYDHPIFEEGKQLIDMIYLKKKL